MTKGEFTTLLGFQVNKESLAQVNNTVSGLKSSIGKALSVVGIGLSLRSMEALIESFNQANDALSAAVGGSEDLAKVTDDVRKAANEARVSYEQMASSVEKTARLEQFSAEEAVQYSANLNKLLQANGHGDYASSVQSQLNRIMQTGQVSSGFTRMLANTPEVLDLLAKQLDVDKDKLADMAKQGKITAETIKDAFLQNGEYINEQFGKTDILFSDALTVVRNNWGFFLNELNDATGIGNELGHVIVDASNKIHDVFMKLVDVAGKFTKAIGGSRNMLKLVGIAIAALGAAGVIGNLQKLVAMFKNWMTVLGLTNAQLAITKLQMLAIIAVVALVLLAIDDFVNFLQGNNSLIGEMMENAGIDVDAVRQKFIDAWERIKDVGLKFKEGFGRLWEIIGPILLKLIELIGNVLAVAVIWLAEKFEDLSIKVAAFVDWAAQAWKWLKDLWDVVTGLVQAKFAEEVQKWSDRFTAIKETVISVKEKILEIVDAIVNSPLGQLISGGVNLVSSLGSALFGGGGGGGGFGGGRTSVADYTSTTNTSNTQNNDFNTSVNNNYTFNVTDAQVGRTYKNMVDDSTNNFTGAVARAAKSIPV